MNRDSDSVFGEAFWSGVEAHVDSVSRVLSDEARRFLEEARLDSSLQTFWDGVGDHVANIVELSTNAVDDDGAVRRPAHPELWQLAGYLAGKVSSSERDRIAEHLGDDHLGCSSCRILLESDWIQQMKIRAGNETRADLEKVVRASGRWERGAAAMATSETRFRIEASDPVRELFGIAYQDQGGALIVDVGARGSSWEGATILIELLHERGRLAAATEQLLSTPGGYSFVARHTFGPIDDLLETSGELTLIVGLIEI